MPQPVLKAFVLCDEIRQRPNSPQMDLLGAGLSAIRSESHPPFPFKQTFWVYLLLTDEKPEGRINLAITRADSGIRYFFREIIIQFPESLNASQLGIRVFNFEFPHHGVYLVELWYDGEWLLDHRLEVTE